MDALKNKVICEYKSLLNKFRKGYAPDYEFILLEISYIDLVENNEIDKNEFILQYYLNNKWETMIS